MSGKEARSSQETESSISALDNNVRAVKAVCRAVEGTLGPKGLDVLLVDRFGDIIVSNDGVTVLETMDVNHPVARMLIRIARAQEDEVGDGTTTATLMAGAIVSEAAGFVAQGVPVTRILEGIRRAVDEALGAVSQMAMPVSLESRGILRRVALVAGRGYGAITNLVVDSAALVGTERLTEPGFKLKDSVTAQVGAENRVLAGVVLERHCLNDLLPTTVNGARILILDDALDVEDVGREALGTESGFTRHLEVQSEFTDSLQRVIELGVNVVVVDRSVDDLAEQVLTDAGVLVIHRVARSQWRRLADHTGARPVKRSVLKRQADEMQAYVGRARKVAYDDRLEHYRVEGGAGNPAATLVVGASTVEVVGEIERIAKDAAAAVQAAVRGGVVPGGGAAEIAIMRTLDPVQLNVNGMAAYGVDCVKAALRTPFMHIVANAGFNPMELVGDVVVAQSSQGRDSIAVDCEDGRMADMVELGIYDPVLVKYQAIKAAGEIAQMILRIDKVIKMKEMDDQSSLDA